MSTWEEAMPSLRPVLLLAILTGALAGVSAGAASAAPIVEVRWTATTGTGTAGGSSIEAQALDLLTAEILLSADAAGISAYSISLRATGALTLSGASELLPPGFSFHLAPGVTSQGGQLRSFDAATLGPGPANTTFAVGRVVYAAGQFGGTGQLEVGFFETGVDGILDNANGDAGASASFASARALVESPFGGGPGIPEPAGAELFALGAALLQLATRRRQV